MQRFENYEDLAKHKVGPGRGAGGRTLCGSGNAVRQKSSRAAALPNLSPNEDLQSPVRCPLPPPACLSACCPACYLPPCLQVTIEEREEYEQHIKMGTVVFAGKPRQCCPCWQAGGVAAAPCSGSTGAATFMSVVVRLPAWSAACRGGL